MAISSTTHFFFSFIFLVLAFKIEALAPNSSFSFTDFEKDVNFEANVAFFGGSKVVNGGSSVQLCGSERLGGVMYKKPIKLFEGKPKELISFSTYFAFSILSVEGDGLAFVMVPSGSQDYAFDKSLSSNGDDKLNKKKSKSMAVDVKFTTKFGSNGNGDSAYCNVAINVHVGDLVQVKTHDVSFVKMSLRNGDKLHTWIDYEASSQRLEVRLNKFGESRPEDPLIWYSMDFTKIWKKSEMFVGLSSVKGNASFGSQPCFLHSWSFKQRPFPHWMHSEPLDLKVLAKDSETETVKVKPRSDCVLRVLAAMIFGGGCGALTAFVVLYLWTIFGNRRPVAPEECVGEKPVDFEYKKVSVVVDKDIKDGKE